MDTNTSSPKAYSLLTTALSIGAVVWLGAFATGMASAQTAPARAAAERISYSDLDLSTEAGAKTLLHRVDLAAHRICGPSPVLSPLLPRAAATYRACVIDAVETAVGRIDAPLVAAIRTNTQMAAGDAFAAR